jgi:hypothetical protein
MKSRVRTAKNGIDILFKFIRGRVHIHMVFPGFLNANLNLLPSFHASNDDIILQTQQRIDEKDSGGSRGRLK